jgi:hypothetical protein
MNQEKYPLLNENISQQQNQEKIHDLEETFMSALEEYKEAYIQYKLNPDIPDFEAAWKQKENALNRVNTQLFILRNSLEKDITKYNIKSKILHEKIEREKRKYKRVHSVYKQVKGREDGADLLISNFTESYKTEYLGNIAYLLSICVVFGFYYKFIMKESSSSSSMPKAY